MELREVIRRADSTVGTLHPRPAMGLGTHCPVTHVLGLPLFCIAKYLDEDGVSQLCVVRALTLWQGWNVDH